jgi:hypothetical protein
MVDMLLHIEGLASIGTIDAAAAGIEQMFHL